MRNVNRWFYKVVNVEIGRFILTMRNVNAIKDVKPPMCCPFYINYEECKLPSSVSLALI